MGISIVAIFAFLLNIPFGRWRSNFKKFSIVWWMLIHASIPFIIALRIWLETPRAFIPLFIALAVLGQYVGKKSYLCSTGKDSVE